MANYTEGYWADVWTPWIDGYRVHLHFVSDASGQAEGFVVDKYELICESDVVSWLFESQHPYRERPWGSWSYESPHPYPEMTFVDWAFESVHPYTEFSVIDWVMESPHPYPEVINVSYVVESDHPYASNANETWTITQPDAVRMRIHFERIEVDDALRRDALAELEAAKQTAQGQRPPPLVNDPRCPRCSLQPICLPDEINHQRLMAKSADGRSVDEKLTPRRLWPPRDDGIHVVLQREGVRVGVRGQSVRITDKDGKLVRDLPLANVESLAVVGPVQLSTQALSLSM